jgi:hypothetical protein
MSSPQKKATPVLRKQPIIRWSDLSLHFIEAHGFFQGKGSPFRLEPRGLVEALFG